ncbi:MAG: MBL fold metallo-hydrolase [Candidatus Helarchaeota archaeon]
MPRLYQIRKNVFTLHPRGNEWAAANVNILRGENAALVDCGLSFDITLNYLLKVLRVLGIQRIDKIILTHSHIDHYQNAGRFAEFFGAEVLAHKNAIPIITHRKQGLNAFEYWELLEEAFPRIFQSRLNWFFRRLILMGNNLLVKRGGKPVQEVTPLAEGDIIDLGNLQLHTIFTPGHSADSLCFLVKTEKLLFTGDMIPWTPYIHTNIEEFQKAIRKIITHSYHNKIKTMVRGHLRSQPAEIEIANYKLFLQDMDIAQRRILALLKKQGPLTAKQMLPYIFRRTHFAHQLIYRILMRTQQFWIAKYLQNLENQKLIISKKEGKTTWYYLL